MILITAAALAATAAPTPRAVVQARATVRIVSAVRLKLEDGEERTDLPAMRETVIRTSDGVQRARLIEFE